LLANPPRQPFFFAGKVFQPQQIQRGIDAS